ncbi:MAG: cation transporter [Ruminococcaceae bacterium]|nr:cation transporter [Oscillospiraceae bacterium]
MIKLLASIFIKDRQNFRLPAVRRAYGMLCGIVGKCLNVLLFAIKFIAGTLSGAISIMADAFNNLSDAGTSVITLIGFKLSGSKPDSDHPFGHGRYEYITALMVAMLIMLMGFELATESISKIITPAQVEFSYITIIILVISVLIKLYMAFYNRAVHKKINSPSLSATAADSLSDCIATTVILGSMIISKVWDVNIDAWCGLAVSAFILYNGFKAAKETISPLLGQPPEKEFVDSIEAIVLSEECVHGIHDLVVHDYGPGRVMISLHAEVPADADMLETHDAIDNIERRLRQELNCEAVIHMDPILTDDETTNRLKKIVADLLSTIGEGVSIHDFRVVTGPTHTNLIFDIVIPYELKMDKKTVTEKVNTLISTIDGNFYPVFNIDNVYVK